MNKHKYLGLAINADTGKPEGNAMVHVIGGPLTGWSFSDAVRQRKCPKCGSDPGYYCQTPTGRKAWPPHVERIPYKGDFSL